MGRKSEHLRSNKWLCWDYFLGLRGSGLVVYGALPASLGALGAFKPPDQAALDSKIGLGAFPFICCVALIPVVLTYVLVRQRMANWYFLPNYLSVRAATITLSIILVSALVCGANGVLVGTYRFDIAAWMALPLGEKAKPIGECFLLSFAYLVGSSTLFLTVVKEDGNLPLLPAKEEIDNLKLLRGLMRDVAGSTLPSEQPAANDSALTASVTALTQATSKATDVLSALRKGFTGLGRKQFYDELCGELSSLSDAAKDVEQVRLTWRYYWGAGIDLAALNDQQKERRTKIERLRGLFPDA
jgi:hypothetical protein